MKPMWSEYSGADEKAQSRFLLIVLSLFCFLIYAYELFNFSLSIDEEYYLTGWSAAAWIQQGRPVMALLQSVLPSMGAMPFLPTLIFCTGLVYFSYTMATLLIGTFTQRLAFGIFVIGCPYWLHIAEFNTISYGVGLSLIILSLGIYELTTVTSSWRALLVGSFASWFCLGVYQSVFVLFVNSLLVLLFNRFLNGARFEFRRAAMRLMVPSIAGVLLYWLTSKMALHAIHESLGYVDSYIHFGDVLSRDERSLRVIRRGLASLLGGGSSYDRYSKLFQFLPALGLIVVVSKVSFGQRRALGWFFLGALLVSLAGFLVISAGAIPVRALIGNSVFIGFFVFYAFEIRAVARLRYPFLGIIAFLSIWLSLWLFGLDRNVRQRDQIVATQIIVKMHDLGVPIDRPVSFATIGYISMDHTNNNDIVEVFGDSFFEHDGGHPVRIAKYINSLSRFHLEPIQDVQKLRSIKLANASMSAWPTGQYISFAEGLVVLKFPAQNHVGE